MQRRTWKIGEPCFIVDMSVSDTFARMRVMPATIIHMAGTDGSFARATSFSIDTIGPQFIEGQPFASEKEAREWMSRYAERISVAARDAPLSGMEPGWNIPHAPRNGDIVYGIDIEARCVFEAQIGFVRLECGRLEVGYDNSEDNVRIEEWWQSKGDAMRIAQERHGNGFSFISKEELVAQTKQRMRSIDEKAVAYAKSPEFRDSMRSLVQTP